MPRWLQDLIDGCRHRSLTRVITDSQTKVSRRVCLKCGKEFEYDLATMAIVKPLRRRPEPPLQQEQTN
jgi:hypothetical protein